MQHLEECRSADTQLPGIRCGESPRDVARGDVLAVGDGAEVGAGAVPVGARAVADDVSMGRDAGEAVDYQPFTVAPASIGLVLRVGGRGVAAPVADLTTGFRIEGEDAPVPDH